MQGMRLGIFAHRAAPVQVNYLGQRGHRQRPYMDYIPADEVVIPQGQEAHYMRAGGEATAPLSAQR